jgi:hypothetical protein
VVTAASTAAEQSSGGDGDGDYGHRSAWKDEGKETQAHLEGARRPGGGLGAAVRRHSSERLVGAEDGDEVAVFTAGGPFVIQRSGKKEGATAKLMSRSGKQGRHGGRGSASGTAATLSGQRGRERAERGEKLEEG